MISYPSRQRPSHQIARYRIAFKQWLWLASGSLRMKWNQRIAESSDVPALTDLIKVSSRHLQRGVYAPDQIERALGPVFGVDEQMIEDHTYFVVENGSRIVGCGGWSFREAMYGGRASGHAGARRLDPEKDAARIRAFFVHPAYARRGIGSAIMRCCEKAVVEFGFQRGEISATLVGEPLYATFGYHTEKYYEIPLDGAAPLKVACMTKGYRTAT